MKLTLAVLALLCLGSAVSASSNAADFKKLPLAGLFAGHLAGPLAEANITVSGDCFALAFQRSQQARSSSPVPASPTPTAAISGHFGSNSGGGGSTGSSSSSHLWCSSHSASTWSYPFTSTTAALQLALTLLLGLLNNQ